MAQWRIVFPAVAMELDLDQTLLYNSRDHETWAFREKTASIPSSRLYSPEQAGDPASSHWP